MNGIHGPALAGTLAACLIILTGCAGGLSSVTSDSGRFTQPVELEDTPFFPQEGYQCGPAALATVLQRSGAQVSPEALNPRVYIPGKQGSLQVELMAAARRYDRIPYELRYGFAGLLAELKAGRPVLVLQNLGLRGLAVWHYAVVVGYDPEVDAVILRSGTSRRRLTPRLTFIRTWSRADFWGLVILEPGELPVLPDRDAYLKAVASLEARGQPEAALPAYAVAVERWPDSLVATLGMGNAYYLSGNLPEAEAAYRRALTLAPRHTVALNNLAQVLAEQGCYAAALENLELALSLQSHNDLHQRLLATRDEILAGFPGEAVGQVSCTRNGQL